MFTKEELQLLKGLVKVSIGGTNRMIKDLERKKQQQIITNKEKKMLEGWQKSKEFKLNLMKKLEKLEHN